MGRHIWKLGQKEHRTPAHVLRENLDELLVDPDVGGVADTHCLLELV